MASDDSSNSANEMAYNSQEENDSDSEYSLNITYQSDEVPGTARTPPPTATCLKDAHVSSDESELSVTEETLEDESAKIGDLAEMDELLTDETNATDGISSTANSIKVLKKGTRSLTGSEFRDLQAFHYYQQAVSGKVTDVKASFSSDSDSDEDSSKSERCLSELPGYEKIKFSLSKCEEPFSEKHALEIFQKRKATNVQVVVGETIFDCHLIVLTSSFEYFGKLKEIKEKVVLPSDQITPADFKAAYNCVVGLPFPKAANATYFINLYKTAQFLGMQHLISGLMAYFHAEYRGMAAAALLPKVHAIGCRSLEQLMVYNMCEVFLQIVATEEFLKMHLDNVSYLMSLTELHVCCEEDVLCAALRWLKANPTTNEAHAKQLLRSIRFPLLDIEVLCGLIPNSICKKPIENVSFRCVSEFIMSAMSVKALKHANKEEWVDNLQRHGLQRPSQRVWIEVSLEHYKKDLKLGDIAALYERFCEYLDKISQLGREYAGSITRVPGENDFSN